MNHLKRKLEKLTNEQIKHVCNKMGVKHGKSKKSNIVILLKPFVKKYKVIENLTTNTTRSRSRHGNRSRSRHGNRSRSRHGNRSRNSETNTISDYWQHLSTNPDSDGRQHYTQAEIKRLEDMYSTGPDSDG
jgi:hypothetical protein